MDRAFAVKRQQGKVSFGRKSDRGEGFQQSRADYRDHRSGRLLFVRAASGKGLHGARNGAAYQPFICDRASSIFGGIKSCMDAASFSTMAIFYDSSTLSRIVAEVQPTELYHLAGQSHVGLSFEIPESTCEEAGMATLRLLEIVRSQPQPLRFYHASSSETFGNESQRDWGVPRTMSRRCG
jgi:hypothetical protein